MVKNYLPDKYSDDLDVLEYSRQMLQNIIDAKSDAFVRSLGFMAKITFNDLLKMNDVDRFSLFVECVAVNRLWELDMLLRTISYGNRR